VILPHLLDEPLFMTRVLRGTVVMGGYTAMIQQPVPLWRDDQSFEDHAKAPVRASPPDLKSCFVPEFRQISSRPTWEQG
jgi:hypothetical protein